MQVSGLPKKIALPVDLRSTMYFSVLIFTAQLMQQAVSGGMQSYAPIKALLNKELHRISNTIVEFMQ